MKELIDIGENIATNGLVNYFVKKHNTENKFRISAIDKSGIVIGSIECDEKKELFFKEKRFYCIEMYLSKGWELENVALVMCNLAQSISDATIYPLYMSLFNKKPETVSSLEEDNFWTLRLRGDGFLADHIRRKNQFLDMPKNQYSRK